MLRSASARQFDSGHRAVTPDSNASCIIRTIRQSFYKTISIFKQFP